MENLEGKVILVTGASDGIGREVARALAQRKAQIVALIRDRQKGASLQEELRALGSEHAEVMYGDLASLQSVRACAQTFLQTHRRLDVLINNAGVMPVGQEFSKDGIELNMAVNYFAPVLLTELLLPRIKESAPARIVQVASNLHTQARLSLDTIRGEGVYDRYRAYANSKLALMLYTRSLSKRLERDNVTVNAVHPGWVRTKLALGTVRASGLVSALLNPLRMRPPERGAALVVDAATNPAFTTTTGAFLVDGKVSVPSSDAQDDSLAEQLQAKTNKLLEAFL